MCFCGPSKWLVVILLVVAVFNAFYSSTVWGWIIALLALVLFIGELSHKRICSGCWGMSDGKDMRRTSGTRRKRR